MTDALSEIARDQERDGNFGIYILNVFKFLNNSTTENYLSLNDSAKNVDSVRGGYWNPGYKTKLENGLVKFLIKLENRNQKAWDFILKYTKDPSSGIILELAEQLKLSRTKYLEFNFPTWID
jgi:hypothetical protein